MDDESATNEDESLALGDLLGSGEPEPEVPRPGQVVRRPVPKKDPDRFTWPPRPTLVLGLLVAAVSTVTALRGQAWGLVGYAIAAVLLMWPRLRGFVDFGGGRIGNAQIPRVRGDVTEPVELSDAEQPEANSE